MTTQTEPMTAGSGPPNAPQASRPLPARPQRRSSVHRWLRGPAGDPVWARPALPGLLAATAVLYLWGLGASGWANSFYSAAAQAGSVSWQAFFYGSSDAANSITVDKTPASLWVMALSARLFGVNSWSILVPQALAGVAAVALLYATVRRWFGPAAALLSGAVLALMPVSVLMFRFNNPDALLVLLLVAGAYAMVRALETASTRWLLLAAACVGFGFLTKMLQALLVVPAFAFVYLLAAPTRLRRRLGQLLLAGVALLVSAGWWIAIVELVPASARPYIGGSQTDSVLELVMGYNGLGRLTGEETGSVGGGMGWGETGWTRLFNAEIGGQIAWLLPASLLLLAAGLWLTRRAPRTDRTRAALLLWGGWLIVTALVFSFMQGIFMQGIFHAYYTVALAPAVGALVGIGGSILWQRRSEPWASALLASTVVVTACWAFVLLHRSPDFLPWLAPTVLVAGLGAAALFVVLPLMRARVTAAVAGAAVLLSLAGPSAYALQTAATPHTGAIPTAGPSVAGTGMGGPGGRAVAFPGGPGTAGGVTGGPGTAGGVTGGPGTAGGVTGGPGMAGGPAPGGAVRGLLQGSTPSAELVSMLEEDAASYTWVAAAVGSNSASGYQLATGRPVMAIGGFNGSDPSPTLEQFQRYVAEGKIHYFIGSGGMRADGGSNHSGQIAAWVQQNFTAVTVEGTTVYDLTSTT